MSQVQSLARFPIHLGLGAKAVPQPPFSGMEWYQAYAERTDADGVEGRLVSLHTFSQSWTTWEMHPLGDEVVVCLAGEITLHQEFPDGMAASITLRPHDYAINSPGVWHTADVTDEATALFITAGAGTEIRNR
jgi:quercetin dioxygenase-like cupin family protein